MHDKAETNDISVQEGVHEGDATIQQASSGSRSTFLEGQVTQYDMVELGREDALQRDQQEFKAISESVCLIDDATGQNGNASKVTVMESEARQHDLVDVEKDNLAQRNELEQNITNESVHEVDSTSQCDINSTGVGLLKGQAAQHRLVEAEEAAQTYQHESNAVNESVDEVDDNASGEDVLEGQAMQHDMVDNEKESSAQRNQEESNGQPIEFSIQKDELIEAIRKFIHIRHQNESRPLPVLLGGKEVDLLGLCLQVRACGGYNKATSTFRWSFISENLGFGRACGAPLKLVYVKYLKALESWSLVTSQEKDVLHSPKMNHLASKNPEEHYTDGLQAQDAGGSSMQGSRRGRKRILRETPSKRKGNPLFKDGDAKDHSLTEQSMSMYDGTDSLAGLLEWLKRLALNPGDPRKGQGPRGSKQNEAWVGKCVATANKLRAILWKGKGGVPTGRPPGSRGKFKN